MIDGCFYKNQKGSLTGNLKWMDASYFLLGAKFSFERNDEIRKSKLLFNFEEMIEADWVGVVGKLKAHGEMLGAWWTKLMQLLFLTSLLGSTFNVITMMFTFLLHPLFHFNSINKRKLNIIILNFLKNEAFTFFKKEKVNKSLNKYKWVVSLLNCQHGLGYKYEININNWA